MPTSPLLECSSNSSRTTNNKTSFLNKIHMAHHIPSNLLFKTPSVQFHVRAFLITKNTRQVPSCLLKNLNTFPVIRDSSSLIGIWIWVGASGKVLWWKMSMILMSPPEARGRRIESTKRSHLFLLSSKRRPLDPRRRSQRNNLLRYQQMWGIRWQIVSV